jgi:putative DNA methylase
VVSDARVQHSTSKRIDTVNIMVEQIKKKKLIEVALPLEAINKASAVEKGNPFLKGHPRNLHQWWARRPQAAARSIIFAQMVDDPSAHPDIFKTEKAQEKERQRLFRIIEELAKWENTNNEVLLQQARDQIWQSWRYTCAENADHPRAKELFDRYKLPAFHDPFAGGGALPLEAQRLGLESYASDLNPVAVLINKVMIEIPPKFAGLPPVNPESRKGSAHSGSWKGAQGLAEDVRYYGQWMRDEADKRIGHLYPKVEVTSAMSKERPDLKKYVGRKLTVIAWLWVRTVKSPNPAFTNVDVPLASTFMLYTKAGKEVYVKPVIDGGSYRFTVEVGTPIDLELSKNGTKLSRGANFKCLMSDTPMTGDYIKGEGKAGRMGARLMAIVAEGERSRVYLEPTEAMEAIALTAVPTWKPDTPLPADMRSHWTPPYGLTTYGDLFTSRQLVAMTTFSDLIRDTRDRVLSDAIKSGLTDDGKTIEKFGSGATAYADAISIIEALALDKLADYNNSICTWNPTNQNIGHLFSKQAIPMAWDFPEISPLDGGMSFDSIVDGIARTLEGLPASIPGFALQQDCATLPVSEFPRVVSTDPPYYDNIGYADLSDFFYVWLRRSLKSVLPELFATLAVPKTEELVATPYRHGTKDRAEIFFLAGMTKAMQRLAEQAHPAFPITIYYAFKQGENDGNDGTTNTGWDTFLGAVIEAGFAITGTWPIRTERGARAIGIGTNALASSIVLVCRKSEINSLTATRREFVTALKSELPQALAHLQRGNIAPVDLAQAAIGPGMAIYTRYAKVLDAEGKPLTVRAALALINQTLDEALAEQEGDFDADTRWSLTWFEQMGFAEGDYGVAEQLSKSKNTAVAGLVEGGILISKAGKVRLLKPVELALDWDPSSDKRLTVWEMVHQLVRVLEASGEGAASVLVAKLGSQAETARELCYRLYTLCERKKRAAEAMAYNGLVQSWPEITRLAREKPSATKPGTDDLFD